jgi:hypothetical protein
MDRIDIYAAMDAVEQEEQDEQERARPLVRPTTLNFQGGMSVEVDGVPVATLGYVKRLERIIADQNIEMKKMARQIKLLTQGQRQHRTIVNNHTGRFADIHRDLEGKIDRRD